MQIKQVKDIEVKLPLGDLMALMYHARRSEVLLAERNNMEQSIVRMRAELRKNQAIFDKWKAAADYGGAQNGEEKANAAVAGGEQNGDGEEKKEVAHGE